MRWLLFMAFYLGALSYYSSWLYLKNGIVNTDTGKVKLTVTSQLGSAYFILLKMFHRGTCILSCSHA